MNGSGPNVILTAIIAMVSCNASNYTVDFVTVTILVLENNSSHAFASHSHVC